MGCTCAYEHNESKPKQSKPKGTMRIILLGTQGSGKSTFVKQMKILNCGGFDQGEKDNYKAGIRINYLQCIKDLCNKVEQFEYRVYAENAKHFRYFKEMHSVYDAVWDDKLVEKLRKLLEDDSVVKARQNWTWKPQLPVDYLMEHFDRLTKSDYVPTDEDILMLRQRTAGAYTTSFIKDRHMWEIVDLGGQESEREKWNEIMDSNDFHAVIYLASLDEFNTYGSPCDKSTTTMETSMQVFQKVLNDERLKDKTKILFLNKTDLLQKKN